MIGNNAFRYQTIIRHFVGWSWQFFPTLGTFYQPCRTLMLLPVALVEIYNHNLRSISAWRNLCNYAHGIDINIWGSHKASCEPLSENWRSNHIEYTIISLNDTEPSSLTCVQFFSHIMIKIMAWYQLGIRASAEPALATWYWTPVCGVTLESAVYKLHFWA